MWNAILLRCARIRSRGSGLLICARYISSTPILRKEENLLEAYSNLIRYFTFTRDLEYARKLHGKIVDRGMGKERYLLNLITEMYGKCGSFEEAKAVFDRMEVRDQMSWTSMIIACSECDRFEEGLDYYRRTLIEGAWIPDLEVLNNVLACVETIPEARKIHDQVVSLGYNFDMAVMRGIFHMYRRCGRLDLTREVFEKVERKDMALWTSMLSAYARSPEDAVEGLKIFFMMELEGIRPDKATFIGLLCATANYECACNAKLVHERVLAHGVEKDSSIASAMLQMHGKCGNLELAKQFFESLSERNLVAWNLMISSYSYYGQSREALQIFKRIDQEGLAPDYVSFASALDACADLKALELGKAFHDRVVAVGLDQDQNIVSGLLYLYGRCGKVEEARKIFDDCWKNLTCWNFMVTAYAQNGRVKEALELFGDMCHQGVDPDDTTFVVLVAACGHCRKMDAGRDLFRLFLDEYLLEADAEHYSCMVDMFARSGKLQDAEELIDNMPFYPDVMAWTAILRACKDAKDFKRSTRLSDAALEWCPERSGAYLFLSQLCAEIKQLENQGDNLQVEKEQDSCGLLDLKFPLVCACATQTRKNLELKL